MPAEVCSENTKPGTTRTFIAVELPADLKRLIAAKIEGLRALAPRGMKWVDPRIAHLTLAFLGNVPDSRLTVLSRVVDNAATASRPFTLNTGPLGAFPNNRRPRVLWLGLRGATESLTTLHSRLQDELEAEGFAVEKRPFKPHVTLGRARGKGAVLLGEDGLNPQSGVNLEFQVRELVVMSSVLTPRGPIHTPLHRSGLSSKSVPA